MLAFTRPAESTGVPGSTRTPSPGRRGSTAAAEPASRQAGHTAGVTWTAPARLLVASSPAPGTGIHRRAGVHTRPHRWQAGTMRSARGTARISFHSSLWAFTPHKVLGELDRAPAALARGACAGQQRGGRVLRLRAPRVELRQAYVIHRIARVFG
jgi:hypothetical protein